jgi:hypothetical protein
MKACAAIAERCGAEVHILESGALLEFVDGEAKRAAFPISPILIDNYGDALEKKALNELKQIAREGVVVIAKRGKRYFAKTVGIMLSQSVIKGLCASLGSIKSGEDAVQCAKKYIKKRCGRKPLVVQI